MDAAPLPKLPPVAPDTANRPFVRLSLIASAACAMTAWTAFGQSDNFDDGNDAGWTRYTPLSAFGAGATYSFPGGAYRIAGGASPAPDLVGPQRAGSVRSGQTYSRARVAADITAWSTEFNQSVGLVARINDLGLGTTKGYTFNYNTVSGYHQLNLVVDETPARAINESLYKLDPTRTYRLVFTLLGDKLLGQVFGPGNASTPLHSVFGQDDTYASGIAGVFVYTVTPTGTIDGRFDNYEAAAAPAQVRATFLTASPHPDEQPTAPIELIQVELADLDTAVKSGSVRLEIDGEAVAAEVSTVGPRTYVQFRPPTPLPPEVSHRGRISFGDDAGTQSFDWNFGAPPPQPSTQLVGAARPEGPYAVEETSTHDAARRRFSVPVPAGAGARFFRVQDTVARKLTISSVGGGQLVLSYE